MNAFTTAAVIVLYGLAIGASSAAAQTPQPSSEPATITSAEPGRWIPVPDLFPRGAEIQVLRGDPATGPAEFYFRVPSNYTFPWHFHTPVERLFMDEGTMRFEMRGGRQETVEAGDYVYVPPRSPHRVTCTSTTTCLFFLSSSAPFDIHLVDENWRTTRSWRAGDPPDPASTTGRQ